MSFFEKYADKIVEVSESGCWIWTGATQAHNGYGRAYMPGAGDGMAHRFAYTAVNPQQDISGAVIMHRCDVPSCVNPAHLRLGTQAENMRDMDIKGRRRPARGERVATSRLTKSAVEHIRARIKEGHGVRETAREMGVSHVAVLNIINGRTWRHA
jgi:hypothetical protein